jgi:hypothetical protein
MCGTSISAQIPQKIEGVWQALQDAREQGYIDSSSRHHLRDRIVKLENFILEIGVATGDEVRLLNDAPHQGWNCG